MGETQLISYDPSSVKIKVRTPVNTLMFISDAYYPGWRAKVDDKDTKIYRANYAFRSVVVPKGEHIVEFYFEPESFKIGIYVSIFGVTILVGVIVGIRFLYHLK